MSTPPPPLHPAPALRDPVVLALDFGTQSVRAVLVDADGETVARAQVAVHPYVSPQPGWAEQDAEYLWESLAEACRVAPKVSPFRSAQ